MRTFVLFPLFSVIVLAEEQIMFTFAGTYQVELRTSARTLRVKLSASINIDKNVKLSELPFSGCRLSDGKPLISSTWLDETSRKLSSLKVRRGMPDCQLIYARRFSSKSASEVKSILKNSACLFLARLNQNSKAPALRLPSETAKRVNATLAVIAYGDTLLGFAELYQWLGTLSQSRRRTLEQKLLNYTLLARFIKGGNLDDPLRFDKFFRGGRGYPDRKLHGKPADFISLLNPKEARRFASYCLGWWLENKFYSLSPAESFIGRGGR